MVFEVDSPEARDHFYLEAGHASQEENDQFDKQHPETAGPGNG